MSITMISSINTATIVDRYEGALDQRAEREVLFLQSRQSTSPISALTHDEIFNVIESIRESYRELFLLVLNPFNRHSPLLTNSALEDLRED